MLINIFKKRAYFLNKFKIILKELKFLLQIQTKYVIKLIYKITNINLIKFKKLFLEKHYNFIFNI